MSVPIVVRGGILVDNGTSLPVDPFGRVRVSAPNTFMQSASVALLPSLRPLQLDVFVGDLSGAATVTQDLSASVARMTAGPGAGISVRQTRQYIPYQAGKGRLIFISAALADVSAGLPAHVTSRLGCFDDFAPLQARFGDGHFFELAGAQLSVVERSSVTGSPSERRVPRSAWNGDRLDGTGPSKFTMDVGRMQLFWIDMEWLGVGEVRMGVVVGGVLVRCHTFSHVNLLTVSSYTRTPKLPVRHEIAASELAAAAGTMAMACSTVISEGGFVPRGLPATLGAPVTGTVVAGTTTAVLAVSLRPEGYLPRATLIPQQLDVIALGNHPLFWQIRIDYSGAANVSAWTNADIVHSAARYATSAALTAGIPANTAAVAEGSVLGRAATALDFSGEQGLEGQPYLAANFAGVPDTLYVVFRPLTNQNVDYSLCFRWQEILV
jgi:hypothetical protein